MRRTMLGGAVPAVVAVIMALTGLASAQPGAPYVPGPLNIELPADWQARFIRYATVDKPDRRIIRHMYVNPEAHAATRAGQPAPHGTLLIMADTRARLGPDGAPLLDTAGRFIPEPGWIAIGAQRKEAGWGEGYGPDLRNGEWEYAAFDGAGARRNVSLNGCFACHLQARAGQDFNFTYWDHAQVRR